MKLLIVAFVIVAAAFIHVGQSAKICIKDATKVTNGIYKYYIFAKPQQKVTQVQATHLCSRLKNGRLISLVTSLSQKWMEEVLAKTNLDNKKLEFWTSGRYFNNSFFKGWFWYKFPALFFNWAPGEPNNLGGKEECLEVRTYKKNKWNDLACHLKRNFICTARLGNRRTNFKNETLTDFDINNNLKYMLK